MLPTHGTSNTNLSHKVRKGDHYFSDTVIKKKDKTSLQHFAQPCLSSVFVSPQSKQYSSSLLYKRPFNSVNQVFASSIQSLATEGHFYVSVLTKRA